MVRKYATKHFKVNTLLQINAEAKLPPVQRIKPMRKSFKALITFLKLAPFLCLIGFGVTLFWDPLAGIKWMIFGYELAFDEVIKMVSVSGLIGYGTNYIAIRMLFKPLQKRPIWGQGLIPAQRDRIIGRLAAGIHGHILNQELIHQRINDAGVIPKIKEALISGTTGLLKDTEFHDEIRAFIKGYLHDYMTREEVVRDFSDAIDEKLGKDLEEERGLKGFIFRSYKRMNPEDYDSVLQNIVKGLPDTIDYAIQKQLSHTETLSDYLESNHDKIEEFLTTQVVFLLERIDIYDLLSKQMSYFDEEKLEKMIWNATNEQLIYIQLLGTVLGILGGLLIWKPPVMMAIYAGTFVILFGLDMLLFNLNKSRKAKEALETKH